MVESKFFQPQVVKNSFKCAVGFARSVLELNEHAAILDMRLEGFHLEIMSIDFGKEGL